MGAPESPVSCLQLKANGLEMPHEGYVTLDVQVLGHKLPSRGILITKDSPSAAAGLPGGIALEGLPEFQHFFDKLESKSPTIGMVKVAGGQHLVVPAGSVMDVPVTWSRVGLEALVEPLAQPIAGNLCVCRTLVDTTSGSFCVKVVNASERAATLPSRIHIGTVHSVEVMPPQVKLEVNCNEIVVHANTASAFPAPLNDESFQ